MSNFYQNKNIWIIGASHGIGEELYRQFNDIGANLIISARSQDKINNLVLGSKNHAIKLDVLSLEDFGKAILEIKTKWQKIDLIIFCAGIYSPMNIDNFNLKEAKDILEVNFTGAVNFLDAIKEEIKIGNIAHLAIISSMAGYYGMPNSMCYGASKAALSNFTQSLYFELKKYQTKVTLINPGFVKTRLTDKNKFVMPLITTAPKIASHIIKELPKNKFEIYFPKSFGLIMKFIGILPIALRAKFFR